MVTDMDTVMAKVTANTATAARSASAVTAANHPTPLPLSQIFPQTIITIGNHF